YERSRQQWQIVKICAICAVPWHPLRPRPAPAGWTDARTHMIFSHLTFLSQWLMSNGRNGRTSTNRAKPSEAEHFFRNWINPSWGKEAAADEYEYNAKQQYHAQNE